MKSKLKVMFLVVLIVICMGTVFADYEVELISANPSEEDLFLDVSGNFWASSSIERWKDDGVINGYEDNTYKPANPITRAEFIAMLERIFVPVEKADLSKYTDIKEDAWYYESMAKAVEMGIINGYSETELAPNKLITRQEAMTIIYRILLVNDGVNTDLSKYSDNAEVADWAKDAIALMTDAGYVNGYEDGTIRPNSNINRAEVAKVLDNTFSVVIRKPGTYELGKVKGNVVIVSENVIISNSEILGSVYVGSAIEKESITTTDTNIAGSTISVEEITEANKDEETVENPGTDEEEKPSSSTGSSGGTSSMVQSFTINIVTSGEKYTFKKTGSSSSIDLKDKLTIKLDGTVIVQEFTISNDNLKDNIKAIISNLDEDKIIATLADYKSNSTVKNLGLKVILAVGREESEYDTFVDGESGISPITLAKRAIDILSVDDLLSLANVVAK